MGDATLDWVGPYRGPCAFCGFNDARHRVAETITELLTAGETVATIEAEYGVTPPSWLVYGIQEGDEE